MGKEPSYRAGPLACGVWHSLQVDSVRMEDGGKPEDARLVSEVWNVASEPTTVRAGDTREKLLLSRAAFTFEFRGWKYLLSHLRHFLENEPLGSRWMGGDQCPEHSATHLPNLYSSGL